MLFLRYGAWRMNCYFSFWAIFCSFTRLTAQKMKMKKKKKERKKCLEISSFYTSVPKIMILCYTVPEIWCVTDAIIFHFGLFFALLPPAPQQPKKSKLKKNEKALGDIILHMCTKNYDQMMYGS